MAAYGALVSVMQIMDQLHRHPHPPISLDKNQSESLASNVTFLQEFLEGYNPHVSYTEEADPLESRIAEAAYAAEDVIESYIVDQINLARSADHVEEISSIEFSQGLEKVIEEMDLIKTEIREMKEKKETGVQIIKKKSTVDDGGSSRSSSTAQKVTTMVGFDDLLSEMLDKLTGGEENRQIIPIVGMGGLGKTTLARNVYENPLIKERFRVCAWSTISQVHNAKKILSGILDQVDNKQGMMGDLSENELGDNLYQYLIGIRYLIVMDDIWNIEAWDRVRCYFPNNSHGSRIVITTRQSNLASQFNPSNSLKIKFLDEDSSWDLFSQIVFEKEICPPVLENIGKKIVEGCRGLPLSIIVAGGLLLKSEPTRENWELIEENLSSVVNSEDGGSCLQILYMSYNNLPIYIKPCFLHMGMHPEDKEIPVDFIIPLCIGEGVIKPFEGKSLEEVARDYIEELVDRNLVLVEQRDNYGNIVTLKMHDLLRDLALREGEKDKFSCVLDREISRDKISSQRRIVNLSKAEYSLELASPLVRSLIVEFPKSSISNFRLLRVCMVESDCVEEEESSDEHYEENFVRLVNLRVIIVDDIEDIFPRINSWASFLWNLQTLYIMGELEYYVLDIWKMPLLRHIVCNSLCLPDPPLSASAGDDMDEVEVVLQNLHTLGDVTNLILCENVIKRITNVKRLVLNYGETSRRGEQVDDDFFLNNLRRLHKLQLLEITTSPLNAHQHTLAFPYSLKELYIKGTMLRWEEMETMIGCLPFLQVLEVLENSFTGSKWETVESQFESLKVLKIVNCHDLECWITDDNSHFPRLEHLSLSQLTKLREIPSSIGDIPTLRSIRLYGCSATADKFARIIREEQEEYGNQLLQIQVDGKSI